MNGMKITLTIQEILKRENKIQKKKTKFVQIEKNS